MWSTELFSVRPIWDSKINSNAYFLEWEASMDENVLAFILLLSLVHNIDLSADTPDIIAYIFKRKGFLIFAFNSSTKFEF